MKRLVRLVGVWFFVGAIVPAWAQSPKDDLIWVSYGMHYAHLEMGDGDKLDSGTFTLSVYRLEGFVEIASFTGSRKGRIDPFNNLWMGDFDGDDVLDIAFVTRKPKPRSPSTLRLFRIDTKDWVLNKSELEEVFVRGFLSGSTQKLSASPPKTYRGGDVFFVDQNNFRRRFSNYSKGNLPGGMSHYQLKYDDERGVFWEGYLPQPVPEGGEDEVARKTTFERAKEKAKRRRVPSFGGHYATIHVPRNEPASIGTYVLSVFERRTHRKVVESKGNRDGTIEAIWMKDFDADDPNTPEIAFVVRSAGSGGHAQLHLFKLVGEGRNSKLKKLAAPYHQGLSSSVKSEEPLRKKSLEHRGYSSYRAVEGKVFKSYPLFRKGDPNYKPTGGRMHYVLRFDDRENPFWLELARPPK